MAFDLMDIASKYGQRRLDQAMQPFTDPEAYVNNRMMQNYGVDLNGNTAPVSTTIKYNTDTGAPESVTTKHEVGTPDYSAGADYTLPSPQAQPMGLSMPAAQPMGLSMPVAQPAPAVTPDAQAIDEQRRRQFEQLQLQQAQAAQQAQQMAPAPAGPAVPTVEREVPQPAPMPAQQPAPMPITPQAVAQQAMPAPVITQPPVIGTLPKAGPPVLVAGAPGSALPITQPPAAPVVEPQPVWASALENSQGNVTKLHAIAGNEAYPEDARKIASELTAKLTRGQVNEEQAMTSIKKMLSGDPKATNEVMREMRKQTEEGSYIKAILFARLGLTDLAREEQQKLGAGVKIGQSMLDGKHFTTEIDGQGFVRRAWDSQGKRVDDDKLAEINAGGMKAGTHAFGFTGGLHTLPTTGELLQPRTNAITGVSEFVHTVGPNKGKVYTGNEVPQPQRVGTNAQIALNDSLIKFQSQPSTAFATEIMKLAAQADPGDGSEIRKAQAVIAKTPFAQGATLPQAIPQTIQQTGAAPASAAAIQTRPTAGAAITPVAPSALTPAAAPAAAAGTVITPTTGGVSGRRPNESFDQYQKRLALEKSAGEAAIQQQKELNVAEQKPPAEAKGKNVAKDVNNQRYSDETYGLIKPISDAIRQSTGSGLGTKVDQLAGVFGVGTTGAQAKAQLDVLGYNLVSNVPRFEGAQSDRDVALYERAAGDIANSEKPVSVRLAALRTIVSMLKKYDKAAKNDWTFGNEQSAAGGSVRNRADAIIGQ